MLGLATGTEFRLALYGVVLAAICGLLLYIHHEGYEACKAPQVAAQKAQVEKDLADAKGTINELRAKLAAIPPVQPAPVLRLCPAPSSLRPQPAPQGTQPSLASEAGTGSPRVSPGDTGLDIGPDVQASERAAEVLTIYADETRDWAVKQAK